MNKYRNNGLLGRLCQRMIDSTGGLPEFVLRTALVGMCLSSGSAVAQQVTADAVGIVTDTTGALVPNGKVTITNIGTHETRNTQTNGQGEFTFSLLQVGEYKVRVEASGFKSVEIPAFALSVGDRRRLDVALTVGQQTEVVEVTSEAPALQTDSTSLGQMLETRSVQDLPTQGRNYYTLVQLAPGANQGPANGSSSGNRPEDRRQASEVSVNGQSDSRNNNLLDGMDNNSRQSNIVIVRPSIDAIQELSVLTSAYPAEVGNTAGGVVNVLTRSGDNTFHGSAYEYIRNDALDARDYFALEQSAYRQNQFGGSFGGPIVHNKTFFFADVEDLRIVQGATSTTTVPTQYEQQNPGDFSDVGGPVVPTAAINPQGLALFKLYPLPNRPGASNNFTASPERTQFALTSDGRIDHHFDASNTMFARFSFNNANTLTPGFLPAVNGIEPGGDIFGFQGTAIQDAYNGLLNYTHIFTPNLLLELKAAYTRFGNDYVTLNQGKNVSQQLGIPNINVNSTTTGLVGIYPIGYGSLGESTFEPSNQVYNTFQEAGIVSYTRGTHSFKFGASLLRRQYNALAAGNYPLGVFFFGYAPGLPYLTTNAMANLMLGLSLVAERANNLTANRIRTWETGVFVQDDWRATPKLTLNLGIRYDVFTQARDAKNNLANFDLATAKIVVASASNPSAGVQTYYAAVAPRVGFAVSVTKSTVIRGAFGLSFFPADTQSTLTDANPPFVSAFGPSYLVPLSDMPAPSPTSAANPSGPVESRPSYFPNSYVEQFNLNVQQQFGQNVFTAAYVGLLGRHISLGGNYNPNLPAPSPLPNPMSRAPFAASAPNVTSIQEILPAGASSYNALQTSFNRRFSHGLSLNANYTWAHSLDDVQATSYAPEPYGLLPNQVSTYDYANSELDLRNRFATSVSYSFPFTESLAGLSKVLLNGWQTNAVAFWQGGQPYTVTNSNPQINLGPAVTADRPNRIKSGNLAHPTLDESFDTTAFVPQTFGTAGNSGRNILYGPHQRRVDLSLFRDFPIFERETLQFRAEVYNISNTPTFAPPNSGIGTPGYGSVSSTLLGIGPRIFQFAVKLTF